MDLRELQSIASTCELCQLHKGRQESVFARGDEESKIIVCGMCPGRDENKQGSPFVGKAGKILDEVIEASFNIFASPPKVYITNLVKCFVKPGTSLEREWMLSCMPYFLAQIHFMKPRAIITLGADVSNFLLSSDKLMKELRGKVFDYMGNIKLISTYHPAFLARGNKNKFFDKVVEDFKEALNFL